MHSEDLDGSQLSNGHEVALSRGQDILKQVGECRMGEPMMPIFSGACTAGRCPMLAGCGEKREAEARPHDRLQAMLSQRPSKFHSHQHRDQGQGRVQHVGEKAAREEMTMQKLGRD